MNEQTLRFRIGVFVLSSLLLLAVLITLFGSFPRLFVRAHEYTVRFANAPGVEPGTPVRLSGIRVGEVRHITLDDAGKVRVQIVIEHQYTLRRNEQPTLVHGLLGGDTSIDFLPLRGDAGQVDSSPVPPGDELDGVREATMNTVITQASEVLPTTQEALNDIRKAAQRYEKMAPVLEETAREYRELAKATREMVPELRKTNDEVRDLAKATRETVPEIRKAATDVGGVARSLNDTMPELRRTNEELRELAKESRQAIPDLRKSAMEFAALAKEAREALPEVKRTNEQMQATLITWQKTGERAKLILDANEERIADVLSDENRRNLTAALKNFRAGTENLPTISKKTEDLLTDSQKAMRRLNDTLVKADEVMGDLKQATKPFAERNAAIAKNLDEGTARMNSVAADVQELLKVIDRGDGTLKKLINDPSLYNHLDEAACMIAHLLPKLEPILRDVNVFSDKIARHPESLGVRGAITPGSGLKESPAPLPLPAWGKP